MKNFLGIDFGTTKTLAARWDERTKQALTIRLGRGGDAIPTTIHVDKNGEFSFGEDADDLRATDYAGWKGRIKRDLGRGTSVVLNGQSYRVADLIARFLAYVLRRVEEECFLVKVDQSYHGKVDHAVVTVPALYGPAERDELKQAIKQGGFTSFELLEEPVAAGCAFLAEKVGTELGSHVLVFDWGGGTLDLALVEHRDNQFYLKPEWISGDKNLGGEDIDDSVVEGVDDTLTASIGSIDSQSDQNRLHIRRYLKDGKEQLSRRTKHKFRLPYEQGVREFEWSREEFEHYTASTINQAIACLQGHLERIRNSSVDVEHILLVGGASEIPAVKRRIEEELGLKAIRWEKSQIAVALGAAIRAARTGAAELADSRPKKKVNRQKPPPVPAAFAKEYTGRDSHGKAQIKQTQSSLETPSDNIKLAEPVESKSASSILDGVIPSNTHVHSNAKFDSPGEGGSLAKPTPPIMSVPQNSEYSRVTVDNTDPIILAEDLRIKHIKRESAVKFLGWLMFIIFVVLSLGTAVALFVQPVDMFAILLIYVSFFGCLAYGLLNLGSLARWMIITFSTIGLIVFPIGTFFGIFVLWNMIGKKADFVFSPEYKQIITATPHVQYKVFQGVYIKGRKVRLARS
jgi:actin-like ATPase involved in cell morphogenesis